MTIEQYIEALRLKSLDIGEVRIGWSLAACQERNLRNTIDYMVAAHCCRLTQSGNAALAQSMLVMHAVACRYNGFSN